MAQIMLFPPHHFALVQDTVFRGAYPKPRNLPFLSTLNLKTILSLTPDAPVLEIQNVNLIHYKVDKPKEGIPLNYSKMTYILSLLVDKSNLPIYIHCLDGQLVTGLVVWCLRFVLCNIGSWNVGL